MAKIMVVDDDKIIRERLKKLLETDDYDTIIAEDAAIAIDAFEKEKPDIVILDIKMPGMEGTEALKIIKQKSAHVEVIMVTGHGGIDTAIEALEGGAFGYIQKPIEYDALAIEIKKALEKQGMQKKLDEHVRNMRRIAMEWEVTFNSMKDMISIQDKDFKYARVNKALAETLNMKPEDIIGKKCYKVLHKAKKPCPMCPVKGTLKNKTPGFTEFFDPDLKLFVEVTSSPILNDEGEADRAVVVIKDVSERKWEEGERVLKGEFEAIKKMIITYNHEMNQPLSAIEGYTDVLLDEVDKTGDAHDMLKIINEQTLRAKKILDKIKQLDTFTSKEYIPGQSMIDLKLEEDEQKNGKEKKSKKKKTG